MRRQAQGDVVVVVVGWCEVETFGEEENIIIIFLIQKPLLRSFIIFYIFFFHSYSFHSFLIQNNSPQRFERRTNRGIHVISLCYAHDDMQMNGMAIINNAEHHPTRNSEVSRISRSPCSARTYMGCLSRGWAFIAKIYTQSLVIISHISLTSRNHVRLKLTLNQRESSSFCVECREEHTSYVDICLTVSKFDSNIDKSVFHSSICLRLARHGTGDSSDPRRGNIQSSHLHLYGLGIRNTPSHSRRESSINHWEIQLSTVLKLSVRPQEHGQQRLLGIRLATHQVTRLITTQYNQSDWNRVQIWKYLVKSFTDHFTSNPQPHRQPHLKQFTKVIE